MRILTTPIDGIETIEIPFTTGTKKYNFSDVPNLHGKIIKRICVYYRSGKKTPNGVLIDRDNTLLGYLTLRSSNSITLLDRYPIYYLYSEQNIQDQCRELFNIRIDDLRKSYIEFTSGASPTTGYGLFLVIYYNKPSKARRYKKTNLFLNTLYKYIRGGLKLNVFPLKIKVTDTAKLKYFFDKNYILNGKSIKKIEFVNQINETIEGETVTTSNNPFLVITDKHNRQVINNMPVFLLQNSINCLNTLWLNNIIPDWNKSFVFFQNTTDVTANNVYYFLIYY